MSQTLQDHLISALSGLARAAVNSPYNVSSSTLEIMLNGLTLRQIDINYEQNVLEILPQILEEKKKIIPSCFACGASCGRNDDYDMQNFWNAEPEIHYLKSTILLSVQSLAHIVAALNASGRSIPEADEFFYTTLFMFSLDDLSKEELLPTLIDIGKFYSKCTTI